MRSRSLVIESLYLSKMESIFSNNFLYLEVISLLSSLYFSRNLNTEVSLSSSNYSFFLLELYAEIPSIVISLSSQTLFI